MLERLIIRPNSTLSSSTIIKINSRGKGKYSEALAKIIMMNISQNQRMNRSVIPEADSHLTTMSDISISKVMVITHAVMIAID